MRIQQSSLFEVSAICLFIALVLQNITLAGGGYAVVLVPSAVLILVAVVCLGTVAWRGSAGWRVAAMVSMFPILFVVSDFLRRAPFMFHPVRSVSIGESDMSLLQNSNLYRALSEGRTDVEIWDDKYSEDGWDYFSIVAFVDGGARKIAYVRVKDDRIQKRTYDGNGDDLWIDSD